MEVPLQIHFQNLEPSAAVETYVRQHVRRLERHFNEIVSCRVTLAAPHKHHSQGNLFQVTVDVRLPGGEVVASRHPDNQHAHEDAHVAIRDAFNATRRRLEHYIDSRRGRVKTHQPKP